MRSERYFPFSFVMEFDIVLLVRFIFDISLFLKFK